MYTGLLPLFSVPKYLLQHIGFFLQVLHTMKYVLFSILVLSGAVTWAQTDTAQKTVAGRTNSVAQQQKPYVILISIDGFRYDYARLHHANNILNLSKNGVSANYMQPAFPSLTFPNHYTIITGLYPSHHGLVGNSFYSSRLQGLYTMRSMDKVTNGQYYGGTPLWVLAEQQQMVSASFYWVGSEADIQGVRPTYYYRYNEQIGLENRIKTVVNWLSLPAETRPHLITFYFPEVDHAGHDFGPNTVEVRNAVQWVDAAILKLTQAVDALKLNVNYILVSDHGMTQVDTKHPVPFAVDTTKFFVGFSQEIINVYAKDPKFIERYYQQLCSGQKDFKAYLKKDVPPQWHYGTADDVFNRIGDIVLVPNWPQVFSMGGRTPKPGAHGFDPAYLHDMRAIFYAWGPAFKKQKLDVVRNVDVYPVVARILGLQYNHAIDGSATLARQILHSKFYKQHQKTRAGTPQN